jgi:PadR family transcriptional regulator, regulatory protein AphA
MSSPRRLTVSTLGYALLGLLARGTKSGYDLAAGLKEPVGFFWHAHHSQIYPELARLESTGLVTHVTVEQSDRPDKKVYSLTAEGRETLKNWLEAPTEVPKKRDELVLKAYSIWISDPAAAAELMRDHGRAHAAHRASFEDKLMRLEEKAGASMWQPDSPWFGIHAALRRGIGYEREYEIWCEWVAEALSGRKQKTSRRKG